MTALDERPATTAPDEPGRNTASAAWCARVTDSGFWCEPWCPPHCSGHVDPSMPHYHTTDLEHFGEFGVVIVSETGRPARVAVCDPPTPQMDLTAEQANAFAAQLARAARVVARINADVRPSDAAVIAEMLGLMRADIDGETVIAAYDDLTMVIGSQRLAALDEVATQAFLAEQRAAGSAVTR